LEEGEEGEENEDEPEGIEMDEEDAEWMMQQMLEEQEVEVQQEIAEDEEIKAAEPEMSREDRIRSFREMLREGSLNVFGTWESQMSEFANDKRFNLIESAAERQDLFDQACSELLASKRKSKDTSHDSKKRDRLAEEHLTDPFGQLLAETVTKKMSFARFCQKHLKDQRYLSLKTSREREKRFLQHLDSINAK
ncbi:hypothetical protein LPJ73_007146, partial [Coemansia sp. RSA 2703]